MMTKAVHFYGYRSLKCIVDIFRTNISYFEKKSHIDNRRITGYCKGYDVKDALSIYIEG